MRLFLGVEPDHASRVRLGAHVARLRQDLGETAAALRWTPVENLHITMHFLGDVAPAAFDPLKAALDRPLSHRAFTVELTRAGVFPKSGPPSVLWIGADAGATELAAVHAELGDRLKQAGLRTEMRPFAAHVTIARVRERERREVRRLGDRAAAWPAAAISWVATHVSLFESHLGGPAPRYESILAIPLPSGAVI